MTVSGTTTPAQSRPWSDGNKGALRIPQSFSITEASPSNCFTSYPGHSLRELYPFAEMMSVYSAATVNWVCKRKKDKFKKKREIGDYEMSKQENVKE